MSDNNDPIKSYSRSKFSRLYDEEDLSGGNENKYEYDDYYEEQPKAFTINEYGINRKRGLDTSTLIISLIMIYFAVFIIGMFVLSNSQNLMPVEETQKVLSPKEKNEQRLKEQQAIAAEEKRCNSYDLYNVDSMNFDQGITIPTIYKYMSKATNLTYQKYRFSDKRFGNGLTTIEIIYTDDFLNKDIENYIQALQRRNYSLKNVSNLDQYCLVKKEKDSDIFTMVIIEKNRVVYGAGRGDYSDYIEENKRVVYEYE